MEASPAKTALLYSLAGLAAGHAIGHPKFGAAVGLGLGLRAPRPGARLFDKRGDPRELSRSALGRFWIPGLFSSKKSDWRESFGKNRSARLRAGDLEGSPYATAPKVARSVSEAQLAAAYAFKYGKGSTDSISRIAQSGPWASEKSPGAIIDRALSSGVGPDGRAYLIGVKLRSKGVGTPIDFTSKRRGRSKPAPPRSSSPQPRPAPAFFTQSATPSPASSLAETPWFRQRGVIIGAGVLGASLVLALVLGRKRR